MQPIDSARRPSLAVMVADAITEAVLNNELRLGAALSEEKLATTLRVSRTPVREALTALHLQGLVVIQPQRGTFVFLPSGQDVGELCELRNLIEGRAMELCHSNSKAETIRALQLANREMRDAQAKRDPAGLASTDMKFHDALLAGCGNRHFGHAYSAISGRISALRSNLLRVGDDVTSASVDEHDAIITAFKSDDLSKALSVLSSHVLKMRGRYETALQNGSLAA